MTVDHRRKLPAYGKALQLARRAGDHPLVVHLIYGDKWFEEPLCGWNCAGAAHPKLALRPAEYEAALYDFRLVTGLQVALFDQAEASADPQNKVFDLIGEIARWSADVCLHLSDDFSISAHVLAQIRRRYVDMNDASKNHGWPRWWSADTERANEQRRNTWLGAALRDPESV